MREDVREDVKMSRCERRCEDEKMFYRPPLLEEPCAQTLSGKKLYHELKNTNKQKLYHEALQKMVGVIIINVEFPAEKQEQAMNFVMCADKRVHQWPTNMDSIFATKN